MVWYGGLAIPGWGLCTFDTGWCSAVYRVSCIVHRALCIVYHVSCIVYGALHRGWGPQVGLGTLYVSSINTKLPPPAH